MCTFVREGGREREKERKREKCTGLEWLQNISKLLVAALVRRAMALC